MAGTGFEALAAAILSDLEAALEAAEVDLDIEAKGDGVVELTFGDGSKIVVNRHSAAQEVWVAARAGGFHYRWDGALWRDTRTGEELFSALSRLVSAQARTPVVLAPPERH